MDFLEMRKEFNKMLGNIDIRMFLKASPLESGERSKLDKVLTNDMYYSCLYANSGAANNLIAEIKDKIEAEDTHNFILSGYKGCGKSTFVGYFLRNIDARSLVIQFDDHWEPNEGIYQNIVMFLFEKIYRDILVDDENATPCVISEKYIEIFNNNTNGEVIERQIDFHNFFTYFTHKLIYAVRLRKEPNYNRDEVKNALTDHVKAHIKSGSISNVLMLLVFWDIADRIANQGNRKCCIVFENLDVIHNTEDIPELVKNYVAFRNNIDRITESIYYEGKPISDPTQDYIMIFVMRETTKGEFSNSIAHFSDRKIRFHHFMAVSEVYDVYDIISVRYHYLESIKDQFQNNPRFCKMMETIQNIRSILANPTMRKRIYAIFNNDYRTCVEALEQFGFSDQRVLEACNRLANIPSDENWPAFGYRSVIYRQIFNVFVRDVFFERVQKYEYSISDNGQIGSINLDRMILLYLHNSQNALMDGELREREYVPINTLFTDVLKFCKDSETIVEAIWNMYDLQNTVMWNHFVTFDDMNHITEDELRKQMEAVVKKRENVHFSKIKITLAGQVYLTQILPHFEYYASRSNTASGYSLFSLTPEELCNIHTVENAFKSERQEVVDCCKRMFLFFKDVFDTLDEFKGKNFLETKFASRKLSSTKKSISRMYHGEKIVYSSIGFLNNYRYFVFYLMDTIESRGGFSADVDITDFFQRITECSPRFKEWLPKELFESGTKCILLKEPLDDKNIKLYYDDGSITSYNIPIHIVVQMIKICYNKLMTDRIIDYMRLFGFYGGKKIIMYSQGTEYIYKAFNACIAHKIEQSNYEDFNTSITYAEGEQIQAEINRRYRQERHRERQQRNRKKQERTIGGS